MKKVVIVSGAAGLLGEAYLKHFCDKEGYYVMGLVRGKCDKKIDNVEYINVDLLDLKAVEKEIGKLSFSDSEKVILIHPVGKFHFEELKESDQLTKDIYDSNVTTFINVANCLAMSVGTDTKVVFCCFGSVSDKYNVPYWRSYTRSKNELRGIVRDLSSQKNVRGVFVNVSTVNTGNENKLRPLADKTFWLRPGKIVTQSVGEITNGPSNYVELDIFEPDPHFKEGYYLDKEALYKKWKNEMGKE